jgi:hypothetical protein
MADIGWRVNRAAEYYVKMRSVDYKCINDLTNSRQVD